MSAAFQTIEVDLHVIAEICLLDFCLNVLKHRFLAHLTTLYLLHKYFRLNGYLKE
jgi:hypothetical protein